MSKRKASIPKNKPEKKPCIKHDDECPICCNPFINPHILRKDSALVEVVPALVEVPINQESELKNANTSTSCNHFFHTECLAKWWVSSDGQTCPLCRHKESLSNYNLYDRVMFYFYMEKYGKKYYINYLILII